MWSEYNGDAALLRMAYDREEELLSRYAQALTTDLRAEISKSLVQVRQHIAELTGKIKTEKDK